MKSSFIWISLLCLMIFIISCKQRETKSNFDAKVDQKSEDSIFFKLSLAQWSLNRTFNEEGVNPFEFAKISKEMGFVGLEYVNHLYTDQIETLGLERVIDSLNTLSKLYDQENVLIMVDGEGDLASPDEEERNRAVENHKKWVDAAKTLGCHSIRVNTFGTKDRELWLAAVVDGLKKLSVYAKTQNINVLCENHGWLSSDAPLLMEAIDLVNMENCGTLPDFGNWCVKRKDGSTWGECVEEYPDKYKGIEMMLSEAKAVSAKSYDFDQNGNETTLDYLKIMNMVKTSGYTGFIGVEYEGKQMPEKEGIIATKNLLLNSAKNLQ